MKYLTLYFNLHQPFRIYKEFVREKYRCKTYTIDTFNKIIFDKEQNRRIFQSIADKCYLPALKQLRDSIIKYSDKNYDFKVNFSISGTFIEQAQEFKPEILEFISELVKTGNIEIMALPYYYSISSIYNRHKKEFRWEVNHYISVIKDLFGYSPVSFVNTALIYNNAIASVVSELGIESIYTEGSDNLLRGWMSPNYLYTDNKKKLCIFLRNYRLTNELISRLTAAHNNPEYEIQVFLGWLSRIQGSIINIGMDFEVFGERFPASSGIIALIKHLPEKLREIEDIKIINFREINKLDEASGSIDAFEIGETVSWTDREKDISAWINNEMQWLCYENLKNIYAMIFRKSQNSDMLIKIAGKLSSADHFYYMSTKPGFEERKYFSPYTSPQEAFTHYLRAIIELENFVINDD